MPDDLTCDERGTLQALGPAEYQRRVLTLFRTQRATEDQYAAMAHAKLRGLAAGVATQRLHRQVMALFRTQRATPAQYAAMAEAVLACSESAEGALVACIDRAVLPACPLCGTYCAIFAQADGHTTPY